MYRYHIVASFSRDLHAPLYETDDIMSTIKATLPMLTSTDTLRYGLQKTVTELEKMDIYPTEAGFDAIIIGLIVYIADMKISRDKQSQDSWTREIFLTIPVFDERWNNFNEILERMLKFLTGDLWSIFFSRREVHLEKTEKADLRADKYDVASMFSGGMDSLIASINFMEQGQPTLLVSHAGESRVRHWQTDLLSALDKNYPDIPHGNVYLWTTLEEIELPNAGRDINQRSRSFLFITIALLAMSGTKTARELLMPENGLIALNVPLDYLRIGSHSTRTTHPFYLKLWNEIANNMFGYSISNPYWNKTKGEMAAECLNTEIFKNIVGQSFSCSSVNKTTIQGHHSMHCGYCLPCIIRRAAMHKAFGNFDSSEYMISDVAQIVGDRGAKGEQLRSFQYAIEKLKRNPAAKGLLIHKAGPLDMNGEYLSLLSDMYYRGLMEVDQWIQHSLEKENAN